MGIYYYFLCRRICLKCIDRDFKIKCNLIYSRALKINKIQFSSLN